MSALKNLAKIVLNSKLFEKVGLSIINYDMLKCVHHYLWIFKLPGIPKLNLTYLEKHKITNDEIHLCERLLKAYKKTNQNKTKVENTTSSLWADGLKEKSGKLISALESDNPEILATALSTMFRERFVYGLASGDLIKHSNSTLGNKIWSLKYYDNIICLAEYLGVVRKESPQQGRTAQAINEDLGSLIKTIEDYLETSINFPDVGSPYGIMANDSLITMEQPEHIYVALRIHHALKTYLSGNSPDKLNLVEIGGGYGGLAFWIHTLREIPVKSYTIIDLPVINSLQGYFLSKAFDPTEVCLFGENPTAKTRFSVLPTFSFESINHEIDVLINENSMPEMNDQIVENYIRVAKDKVAGIFFSYNHEGYTPDQILVPEIMNRVGGFECMARTTSWVRGGYVEESYIKTA